MLLKDVRPNDFGYAQSLGKHMGPAWLSAKYPKLEPEEIAKARALAYDVMRPGTVQQPAYHDTTERKFIAAAWLCGASQSQIGQLLRKAQQTISHQVDREFDYLGLPPSSKWDIRLQYAERKTKKSMPMERLVELYENFEMLRTKDKDFFKAYSFIEVAAMLFNLPNPTEQNDPYDLPTPDRQLNEDRTPVVETEPQPKPASPFSAVDFDWSIVSKPSNGVETAE